VIASLRRILELNQTHVDAKLMLAEQLYPEKRYGDSWATYITISKTRFGSGRSSFSRQSARAAGSGGLRQIPRRCGTGVEVCKGAERKVFGSKYSDVSGSTRGIRPSEQRSERTGTGVYANSECGSSDGTTTRSFDFSGQ
jgi:hypothetical protein